MQRREIQIILNVDKVIKKMVVSSLNSYSTSNQGVVNIINKDKSEWPNSDLSIFLPRKLFINHQRFPKKCRFREKSTFSAINEGRSETRHS